MDFNYNHLYYFWLTASVGSLRAAAEELRLTRSTVSVQIGTLEEQLGEKLIERQGHQMVMTRAGRLVYTYADRMFSEGRALQNHFRAAHGQTPLTLTIGISGVLPKLSTFHILERVQTVPYDIRLVCEEGRTADLVEELFRHRLDVVLSDIEYVSTHGGRYRSHLIETDRVGVYGSERLAAEYGRRFPQSLNDAPLLMPTHDVALRAALDRWLDTHGITPLVVGEFDDSALLKIFAEKGVGLFVAPVSIEEELRTRYGVEPLGQLGDLTTTVFALTAEHDSAHPGVRALLGRTEH